MQSQVLRYIRFFIFGCWGILLLLMLLYGPWMIQAKQITIPDMTSPINGFRLKNVGKAPSSDHWKEGTREDSGRNPGFPANIPALP